LTQTRSEDGGEQTSARELVHEFTEGVVFYFDGRDVTRLWELAAQHSPNPIKGESRLHEIALATQEKRGVVFQAMTRDEIHEVLRFCRRHDLRWPRIEELRLG